MKPDPPGGRAMETSGSAASAKQTEAALIVRCTLMKSAAPSASAMRSMRRFTFPAKLSPDGGFQRGGVEERRAESLVLQRGRDGEMAEVRLTFKKD